MCGSSNKSSSYSTFLVDHQTQASSTTTMVAANVSSSSNDGDYHDNVNDRQTFEVESNASSMEYFEDEYDSTHGAKDEEVDDEAPLVGSPLFIHRGGGGVATFATVERTSRSVLFMAGLLIVIMVAAIVLVPARSADGRGSQQPQCELEVTRKTSWKTFLHMVGTDSATQSSRCDKERRQPCTCRNPLIGQENAQAPSSTWENAAALNLEYIHDAPSDLDVVLIGDSIIEHWQGTDLGRPVARFADNNAVYQQLFQKSKGGLISGLALGIAGDRCQNVLYRLSNGEMPASLKPTIWWILVGTNDKGGDHCTNDNVIAGIINIVEFILQERPNAIVVMNSLLPRGNDRQLYWWDDYTYINKALECYASGTSQVEFFNGTSLFVTNDGRALNKTLVPDEVHPEELGSWIWGRAIVATVQDILSQPP